MRAFRVFEVIIDYLDDPTFHIFVGVKFGLQTSDLVDEGRVVEDSQYELIAVGKITVEYKPGAGHTLIKGPAVEDGSLVITEISSEMMRQLAELGGF
jgi:hypothetical protein